MVSACCCSTVRWVIGRSILGSSRAYRASFSASVRSLLLSLRLMECNSVTLATITVLFQLLRDPDRMNTGFHDNSRNGSIDSPLEPQPAPSLHQDSSSRVYGNPVESNMLSNEPWNNNKSRSPIKEN
jgi:hypothetical protein